LENAKECPYNIDEGDKNKNIALKNNKKMMNLTF